ncbi:hypothetical protein Tco_1193591 [Tanacetum coccineum]
MGNIRGCVEEFTKDYHLYRNAICALHKEDASSKRLVLVHVSAKHLVYAKHIQHCNKGYDLLQVLSPHPLIYKRMVDILDAKYEHVGQDTRSQGGKDDQDGRIKI